MPPSPSPALISRFDPPIFLSHLTSDGASDPITHSHTRPAGITHHTQHPLQADQQTTYSTLCRRAWTLNEGKTTSPELHSCPSRRVKTETTETKRWSEPQPYTGHHDTHSTKVSKPKLDFNGPDALKLCRENGSTCDKVTLLFFFWGGGKGAYIHSTFPQIGKPGRT